VFRVLTWLVKCCNFVVLSPLGRVRKCSFLREVKAVFRSVIGVLYDFYTYI
jgi:hypothetical protein